MNRVGVRRAGAATIAVVLASCSGSAVPAVTSAPCPPSAFRHSPPLVIAHAGGEGLGPANSLLAMERSLAAGADLLDADLRMTADGVVVAQHDRTVVGLAGNKQVDQLVWADLQVADLRDGWNGDPIGVPVRVPSLEEILEAFPDVMISLEIKQSSPTMSKPLCDVLREHDAIGRVYLSANDDDDLYAAQRECPGSTVITTTYRDVAEMREARETGEAWCAPAPIGQPPFRESLLDPTNVAWSHDHGMAIFTWTVDDPDTLRGLAEAGVDAVYTRRPDIAREVFDEVGPTHGS